MLVLNAEAEKLAAEKAKLLAELQAATTEPGPAVWSGKVALAGLDAAASSLREDLKARRFWKCIGWGGCMSDMACRDVILE